ncbi:MAG: glycosyltransferase family 4 protein [Ahrensia sp.]
MKGALAVPGDINTVTGGYIYDKRVLHELRKANHAIAHIALPGSFPNPTRADMDEAFLRLASGADHGPVIIDGLAYGALDPARVAQLQTPIIALVHHPLALENGLDPARGQSLFETEKANLSVAAHVIVPSPHTAALLTRDYGVSAERITIARPGTDRPSRPAAPSSPPLILSVGIQMPRKGHDVLLQALAKIVDLEWHATIVGARLDEAYALKLEAMRRDLNLAQRVTLAGQVDDKTLAELYQTASLFALSTRFEGYGIVFDEAMVHGLPIVSCRTGAVPDTVPADAGLLVAVDAPHDFAAALRLLLTDEAKRQAAAAASHAAGAALPDWSETADAFVRALYAVENR